MLYTHGVHSIEARAESLGAKIGSGVDEHAAILVAHQHGRAQPVVARIGGGADRAMAAERGHAHAGAEPNTVIFSGDAILSFRLGGRFGYLLGDLHETEAQFGEGVLSSRCSSRLRLPGFFGQDAQHIDGVASQVDSGLGCSSSP